MHIPCFNHIQYCFTGSLSIFKRFKYNVEHSKDQRLLDSQLRTAISSNAHPRDIHKLLVRGADVNSVDSLDYTPLLLALTAAPSKHLLGTVELLCEFGANANYSSSVFFRDTPLHFAAALNNYELTEMLFLYKGDVHARNHAGYTPLHKAAQTGSEASATALFLCGADLNCKENYCGYTPLHLAVIGQFDTVVKAIVSFGARIDQLDNCGLTPIDRCHSKKSLEILIEALHPECLSLEFSCLAVIRQTVREVVGINGFDILPLPFTLKRKLKLKL